MQQRRSDWFVGAMQGSLHWVARAASLGLLAWSTLSVYQVFVEEGDVGLRHWFNVVAAVSIVVLGFVVLRNVTLRGMEKASPPMVVVALLYLLFEGYCILYISSEMTAGLGSWIGTFHVWLAMVRPFVMIVVPGFGMALAWLDAHLAKERGTVASVPVAAQRKQQVATPVNTSQPSYQYQAKPAPTAASGSRNLDERLVSEVMQRAREGRGSGEQVMNGRGQY